MFSRLTTAGSKNGELFQGTWWFMGDGIPLKFGIDEVSINWVFSGQPFLFARPRLSMTLRKEFWEGTSSNLCRDMMIMEI